MTSLHSPDYKKQSSQQVFTLRSSPLLANSVWPTIYLHYYSKPYPSLWGLAVILNRFWILDKEGDGDSVQSLFSILWNRHFVTWRNTHTSRLMNRTWKCLHSSQASEWTFYMCSPSSSLPLKQDDFCSAYP